MPNTVKATMGGMTGRGPRRLYTTRQVAEEARPGMRLAVSEVHPIAVEVRSRLPQSGRPGHPVPKTGHDIILSDELKQRLDTVVVQPTITPDVGPNVVMTYGPTGCGKTTGAHYCAQRIDEERDGKLAYFEFAPGQFRNSLWGQSEALVREMFTTARELATEQDYSIFLVVEDAEATLFRSRQLNQNNDYGCGTTAAATTAEMLHGVTMLANDPNVAVTVWGSSNYGARTYSYDPAVMAEHRLRDYIEFPTLDVNLVPDVVATHAQCYEIGDDVAEWLSDALMSETVLARGRRENVRIEVKLDQCLTPAMISGILNRARLEARGEEIQVGHVAKACANQLDLLANRIASHAGGGDLGMIVPELADMGKIQLDAVFANENSMEDDAALTDVISAVAGH